MANYFNVHVFYSRKNSFSKFIKVEDESIQNIDDNIVVFALENKLISAEDAENVDYIEEMTEEEYNEMKGIILNKLKNLL